MPQREQLRITLPKAFDMGNDLISSRQFNITTYLNAQNGYINLHIGNIFYTPTVAKVQLWQFHSGIESGQFGGVNGLIEYDRMIDNTEPIELALFNLSTESDVNFTLHFDAYIYGEV